MSYNWESTSKEDDSWLYLPALQKVNRIALPIDLVHLWEVILPIQT